MDDSNLKPVETSIQYWEFVNWRICDIFYAVVAILLSAIPCYLILYEFLSLPEGIAFAIFFILLLITAAFFAWIFGVIKVKGNPSNLGLLFTNWKLHAKRGLKWLPIAILTDVAGIFLIIVLITIYTASTGTSSQEALNKWLEEDKTPDASNIEKPFREAPVTYFLAFAVLVIVAPICEEIFFRGFVYGALRRRLRKSSSQLISAGFFGICHGLLCFPQFFFGLILAHLYESNQPKSLITPIVLHSLNNTLVFIILVVAYNT